MRIFLSVILFLLSFSTIANSPLEARITIHVDKQPLHKVFSAIEMQANVSFAFQSNIINPNQLVTLHAVNEPLDFVVKKLLDPLHLSYFTIDSQIIIFKPKKNIEKKASIYTDTVLLVVYDTIRVSDTNLITVFDTTRVFDTVKIKPPKVPLKPKRQWDHFVTLHYALLFGTYNNTAPENTDTEEYSLNTNTIIGNQIALSIGKFTKKWSIEAGIGYKTMQQTVDYELVHLKHSRTVSYDTLTFINHDTLAYFLLSERDTAWGILIDTIVRVDSSVYENTTRTTEEQYYKNKLEYLTIPLTVGLRLKLNNDVALLSKLSLNTSILLNADGYVVQSGSDAKIIPFSQAYLSPVVFSGFVSLGLELSLHKYLKIELLPLVGYQFTSGCNAKNSNSLKALEYGLSINLKKYF